LLLAAVAGLPLGAQDAAFTPAVNRAVRDARAVAPAIGVHVARLADGETVYSYRADELRIVASNTKLATTAAALDRLGPGFFFETEVLVRGRVAGGVLDGELAVVGGGDPHLSGRAYFGDSYGPFREWAAALRAAGIERVAGDLVLVVGLFADDLVHPDWPRDQLTRWYEAPVSALSFNDNCILVKVFPGPAPGAPARVETVPSLAGFRVDNRARTTGDRRRNHLRIDRRPQGNVLTVSGLVYRRLSRPVDKWVAVEDPAFYFGAALRAALLEEGVSVGGATRVVQRLAGGGWKRVHTHRTDLLTVIEVVNKRSQNFYAESLLKVLGARRCGRGTWAGGLAVVREYLAEIGLEPGTYRLADGSGMSRNNRFTARQLTRLLRAAAAGRWGTELLRTLPYSGERFLSWEKRLAQPPYRGNVLAKTGTLRGVSALSGLVEARSGRRYVFSILCNQTSSDQRARDAQDAILRAVIDHG